IWSVSGPLQPERVPMGHVRHALLAVIISVLVMPAGASLADNPLKVGYFEIDASPPIGSPLAYDPCVEVLDPLSLRGIVIVGSGDPIVLCAVDWIGISNGSHQTLKRQLAAAAKSQPERVAVHALHQHDAPRCDFSAASLLAHHGIEDTFFDVPWARAVFDR